MEKYNFLKIADVNSIFANVKSIMQLLHQHLFVAVKYFELERLHSYRNHFFCLYQKEKSSDVKFRQASNCCKRVLEDAKFAYANKAKEFITSQKLSSRDFWWIANSVLNKGKSAIPPVFNVPEVLSSASYKAKMFPEELS